MTFFTHFIIKNKHITSPKRLKVLFEGLIEVSPERPNASHERLTVSSNGLHITSPKGLGYPRIIKLPLVGLNVSSGGNKHKNHA